MGQTTDEIVIEDQLPGVDPGLGMGDIFKYGPVIQIVIQAIETAVAGGQTQIPLIKLRIAGKHLAIGPCPVAVS